MKFVSLAILTLLLAAPATAQDQNTPPPTVELIDSPELLDLLAAKDQGVLVVNFWATWCVPCVAEMPVVRQFGLDYADQLDLIMVSLDFEKVLDTKVVPFVEKHQMQDFRHLLMTNTDYNSWIPKVHPDWDGSIPATLVVNPATGKSVFAARELHEGDLESMFDQVK